MKVKFRHVVIALIILVGPIFTGVTHAQSSDVTVVHMVGDKDGVWLYTSDNRLIYCWWPSSPSRTEKTASCRVMDQFRANMMR
jgi:hypothetical protein